MPSIVISGNTFLSIKGNEYSKYSVLNSLVKDISTSGLPFLSWFKHNKLII